MVVDGSGAAWPLHWPATVPRSKERKRSRFGNGKGHTVASAISRLRAELARFRATDVVISTNVELRLDGLPYSGQAEPADPGAAVYFMRNGVLYCLPCDRWDRVADNLVAIAHHLDALRGLERWGVGTVEQAFAGFRLALPAPATGWRGVFAGCSTLEQVEQRFTELVKQHHPDRGGSSAEMAKINNARQAARRELGGTS